MSSTYTTFSDRSFGGQTIGTMLLMLKEKYSDGEILEMLSPKKVSKFLEILTNE